MISLKDRHALITGGDSGIGLATAMLFTEFGAEVAILSFDEDSMQNAAEESSNHVTGSVMYVDGAESLFQG